MFFFYLFFIKTYQLVLYLYHNYIYTYFNMDVFY